LVTYPPWVRAKIITLALAASPQQASANRPQVSMSPLRFSLAGGVAGAPGPHH